jgi:RNA polymerase sigma factor (sigma-70 family)|tara:strand:- start:360 stop:1121 length:762 start_codon:yes stop_codon:yes gene_type:complete
MKKYNIQNYVRYKEDVKRSMPGDKIAYSYYNRDELIIKFLPLVENLGRKFPTSQQASGVLSINDIIQIGAEALTRAVDKLNWEMLDASEDVEKTLKSFFSKRIKGAIRRRIDMVRGNIRIPEHKLTEIRKNPKDVAMVQMFFNSIFLSLDHNFNNDEDEESMMYQIPDKSEPYNIGFLNAYLKSLLQKHLNEKEYQVLRLSYGLDCEKHSAKEIADILDIKGVSNYVRVSELKQRAVQKLIENVDHSQVIDYL